MNSVIQPVAPPRNSDNGSEPVSQEESKLASQQENELVSQQENETTRLSEDRTVHWNRTVHWEQSTGNSPQAIYQYRACELLPGVACLYNYVELLPVLCICSNSSNNKVYSMSVDSVAIYTLYYYMYIFYLQPMMTGLSMMNGLALLQASISISEACFYVGILIKYID